MAFALALLALALAVPQPASATDRSGVWGNYKSGQIDSGGWTISNGHTYIHVGGDGGGEFFQTDNNYVRDYDTFVFKTWSATSGQGYNEYWTERSNAGEWELPGWDRDGRWYNWGVGGMNIAANHGLDDLLVTQTMLRVETNYDPGNRWSGDYGPPWWVDVSTQYWYPRIQVRYLSNGALWRNDYKYIGETHTVPGNTPSRTGYEFCGWSADDDAASYELAPGNTVGRLNWNMSTPFSSLIDNNFEHTEGRQDVSLGWRPPSLDRGNTVDLVAVWAPHTYTIRFDGNGATSGSTASLAMTYDVSKNLTPNGFRRSYVTYYDSQGGSTGSGSQTNTWSFTGWKRGSTGYADRQAVRNLTADDNVTLTMAAQWNPGITTLPDPGKRTGYTFEGWYTAASGGTRVGGAGAQVRVNATAGNGYYANGQKFYAHWKANTLTVRFHANNEVNMEFPATDANGVWNGSADPMKTVTLAYAGTDLRQHGLPDFTGGTWNLTRKHYTPTGNWLVGAWNSGQKASQTTAYATNQEFANAIGYPIDSGDRTVDLYAEWRINQYTVTYFRDGEPIVDKSTGKPVTMTFDALTRLGADGGWSGGAAAHAARENCSGGVDGNAWYVDTAGTAPYAGGRLEADLKLRAFNLCTVTFANGYGNLPIAKDASVYGTSATTPIGECVTLDELSDPPAAIAAIRYGTKLDLDRESTQYTTAKGVKTYARTAVGRPELWSLADTDHAYQVNAEAGWHISDQFEDAAKNTLTVAGDTTLYKRWDAGYYEGVRS